MGTVKEIVEAVERLPPDELDEFRAWYEQFDAALFDAEIERDAVSGKLDKLAEQAIEDYRTGRAREL